MRVPPRSRFAHHHPLVGKHVRKTGFAFRMDEEGSPLPAKYDDAIFHGRVVRYDPPEDSEDVYNFLVLWDPYYVIRRGQRVRVFGFDRETMTAEELARYM